MIYLQFFKIEIWMFSPIYLCIQSLISIIWTHEYSFYILGYNPMLLYFAAQIIPAILFGSCVPLTQEFLMFLSSSLLFDDARCFQFFLYISCSFLESAIPPKNPGIFIGEIVIETTLGVRYAGCFWDMASFRTSQLT